MRTLFSRPPAAARPRPKFLFATCQIGAEPAVKHELARRWPELRVAFSRPGFLTFKVPEDHAGTDAFTPRSVFARTWGWSLGRAAGSSLAARSESVWKVAGAPLFRALHVWQRDTKTPGRDGFEPEITPLAVAAAEAIRRAAPSDCLRDRDQQPMDSAAATRPAGRGQLVLDCVLVEPDDWWVGYHRADSPTSRWPGGIVPVTLPEDTVARTYAKMEEALQWSRLPVRAGDRCAEIGSAPGGASQALLGRQLKVIGIDPAGMHPVVLAHPAFRHLKMRGADVKRRALSTVDWLTADLNVAPSYTLDTVEHIVTHRDVHVRGMLLTLKLLTWEMACDVPDYLARVRSWGFADVRARQLARHRQEFCLAALRHRSLRRMRRRGAEGAPDAPRH